MGSSDAHGKQMFVIIPARGGSKGVPGKALKMLGNKPLIAYTIEHALSIGPGVRVHVNTDDPEIRDVAISFGADVPFLRPSELAQDDSDLVDAVRHACSWYWENLGFVYDISVIMSPTYPFRRKGLVRESIEKGLLIPDMFNTGAASPVFQDPNNYWLKSETGFRRFVIPMADRIKPEHLIQSCLSFNIVYEFRVNNHLRTPVILNEIEAIDIDEPEDFRLAQAVIQGGLYPF
jgi:CMP-N-acetylneuraminic acid synthetase